MVHKKENNIIWLEIWCKNVFDTFRKKHRYNVFYITTNINNWICEGDLGIYNEDIL